MSDYIHDIDIVDKYANLNRVSMANEIIKGMRWDKYVLDSFDTVHNYLDTNNKILRKGAISCYKDELVTIPINMRDGSLLCRGLGNDDWLNSGPHGAGRILSRGQAKRNVSLDRFKESMKGIYSSSVDKSTLDESPMAYKKLNYIKDAIDGKTVEIIDVLKPIYNFKASEKRDRKNKVLEG